MYRLKKIVKWVGVTLGVAVLAVVMVVGYLIITTPPTWGTEPVWSSDGTQLAYRADPTDNQGFARIFTSTLDGKTVKPLTKRSQNEHYPSWSPDGSQIAYTAWEQDDWFLFVVDVNGNNQRSLVALNTGHPTVPRWSPDGTMLAIAAKRNGIKDIYSVVVDDTTRFVNLTRNEANDDQPTWSPDGSQLVFTSNRTGNFDLFMMMADGSNVRHIMPDQGRNQMSHWFADSTQSKLAFISNRNGNDDVYVLDLSSQEVQQWTDGPLRHFYPAWSPDGQHLAYMTTSFRQPTVVHVMDVETKTSNRITER